MFQKAWTSFDKAIFAGAGAGVAAFYAAIQDGSLSQSDVYVVVGSVVCVFIGTFLKANKPSVDISQVPAP